MKFSAKCLKKFEKVFLEKKIESTTFRIMESYVPVYSFCTRDDVLKL